MLNINLPTDRTEAAHQVVLALNRIARIESIPADRDELIALRMRISHCNSVGNHYIKLDETGKRIGRFWRCGSKLCADCLSAQCARNRKRLRKAFQAQQLMVGERFNFITLTMPNPKLPLVEARSLIDRAWTLFRKRKLCVDLISGGAKAEEFTLTKKGYHYHLHLIVRSKFLLFNEVRRVWTECVAQAFTEAGKTLEVNTKDQLLLCKVNRIDSREQAIHELCKYLTKSDSWLKIPEEDLRSVALMRRWMRMFELFGSFRDKTILDTAQLSDGEAGASFRRKGWRDRLAEIGLTLYSIELAREVASAAEFQKRALEMRDPTCQIHRLTELQ